MAAAVFGVPDKLRAAAAFALQYAFWVVVLFVLVSSLIYSQVTIQSFRYMGF